MDKIPESEDLSGMASEATLLFRRVLEESASYAKFVGDHLEVNRTDFEAMEHLIQNGPMTAGQLAKAVGVSPGTATVMIDRLVEVGHVTREANPNDRRGVLVIPNPESVRTAWSHIQPLIEASEAALAEMSKSQRQAVADYLKRMLQAYLEQNDGQAQH